MKKFFLLFGLIAIMGCSSENSWDCIQTAGTIVQREVEVPPFSRLLIWERTKVFISQGPEQKVVVETGENLLNDISLDVNDGLLQIRNKNACNLVRDYQLTKVYITAPDISEIRSSTGYAIESIGTLRYLNLTLLSEDQAEDDLYHTDGDFKLTLDVENLHVVANGLSKFYLQGTATNANFGLFAGNCRIYAEDLVVENLSLYHRSTGPMVVNPQQSIKGKIVSIGDVISKNRPPEIAVEELYRGRLIFE